MQLKPTDATTSLYDTTAAQLTTLTVTQELPWLNVTTALTESHSTIRLKNVAYQQNNLSRISMKGWASRIISIIFLLTSFHLLQKNALYRDLFINVPRDKETGQVNIRPPKIRDGIHVQPLKKAQTLSKLQLDVLKSF